MSQTQPAPFAEVREKGGGPGHASTRLWLATKRDMHRPAAEGCDILVLLPCLGLALCSKVMTPTAIVWGVNIDTPLKINLNWLDAHVAHVHVAHGKLAKDTPLCPQPDLGFYNVRTIKSRGYEQVLLLAVSCTACQVYLTDITCRLCRHLSSAVQHTQHLLSCVDRQRLVLAVPSICCGRPGSSRAEVGHCAHLGAILSSQCLRQAARANRPFAIGALYYVCLISNHAV